MPESARQVLAELELCSVTRARAYAPVVTGSTPGWRAPAGADAPADHWRERFAAAAPGELPGLVVLARAELRAIKRRRFPVAAVRDGDDLRVRVLADGEGLGADEVALALRCTPTYVRRARLIDGRDAERGRPSAARGARELVAAGLSIRAAAAVSGVPRSTLAGRLQRAAHTP